MKPFSFAARDAMTVAGTELMHAIVAAPAGRHTRLSAKFDELKLAAREEARLEVEWHAAREKFIDAGLAYLRGECPREDFVAAAHALEAKA